MIFFITGSSSCGKTYLLEKLKPTFADQVDFLSADDFFKNFEKELRIDWKNRLDWSGFQDQFQKQSFQKWIDILNTKGDSEKLLVVDDIVINISGYCHELLCPFRIFLISVPLNRLFLNVKKRKNRKAGQILKELRDLYEPSPYPTNLIFQQEDLEKFLQLTKYSGLGVKSQIPKTKRHFFGDGKEKVFIRTNVAIPLPITVHITGSKLVSVLKKKIKKWINPKKI